MARAGLWDLFRAFVAVGTQSLGGGSGTLFMMRRVVVERYAWMTQRAFTEAYALSQLSPGMHFVALAGLIGRSVAGPRGIVVAVAAMMVPASFITALMTAAFGSVAEHPLAIAGLAGVGPVAAGMTLGLAFALGRPVVQRGARGGLDLVLVIAAFGILLSGGSTVVVIVGAGLVGALLLGRGRPTSTETPM